jgi:hypothetical protein
LAPEQLPDSNELSQAVDDFLAEQQKAPITEKIRFVWSESDQSILDRIDVAAATQFAELFADAIAVMNGFYAALRVPVHDPHTGMTMTAPDGSWVWETDPVTGRPLERWSQLDGADVEQCIMNLTRLKLWVAPEVNKLKSRAVYAKMVSEDTKDDARKRVASGTVVDKNSKANRESRQDRYHAYFVYHLWSTAQVFLDLIVDFIFRLRDVRSWRVQAQQR